MRLAPALATLTPLLLAACSPAGSAGVTDEPAELVVFAAASLSGSFTELGAEFEADHPGARVRFSFEGSSTLADQLEQGAPADVFASADRPTMDRAVAAGTMAGEPRVFATNVLTLVVAPGNPAAITGLDASLEGRKLVVCAPAVPCGAATAKLAALLGVTLRPVSEESRVTDVRAKVETGQADAGVVYVTDAKASGEKVGVVPIAGAERARNDYLIGTTHRAARPALAAGFIELVRGGRGRAVLAAAGFGQ